MPIVAGDILLKLSAPGAAAGNTTAGVVGNGLGKYISTTQVGAGANTLFPDITGAENAASQVDYCCVFAHNNHGSLTLTGAKVYLSAEVGGGAVIAIWPDTTGSLAVGSASVQALTIANDTTAPAGSSFSSPTTQGTALVLGDIAPGFVRAFWVRRTASNSAAVDNDGVTLAVFGDTL